MLHKTSNDRVTAEELGDQTSGPTTEQLFVQGFQSGVDEFTASFVDDTAERFLRALYQDRSSIRRMEEARNSSYRTREALGRYLAMYLSRVRENQCDVQEASTFFFTHLSRKYWASVEVERERFSAELEKRAGEMSFESGVAREEWIAGQERSLQASLQDVFGRLAGVMNGVCVAELLRRSEESSFPEGGDLQIRGRVQKLLSE